MSPTTTLHLLLLLLTFATHPPPAHSAFKFARLVNKGRDKASMEARTLRTFKDNTVLLALESSLPISDLTLHPQVVKPPRSYPSAYNSVIIMRLNPRSGTVFWASAFADDSFIDATLDAMENIYLLHFVSRNVGSLYFREANVIKLHANGTLAYSTTQQRGSKPRGDTHGIEGTRIRYAAPNSLLLEGTTPYPDNSPLAVVLNANDGTLRGIKSLVAKGVTPNGATFGMDAVYNYACYVTTHDAGGTEWWEKKMFVHCFHHEKMGSVKSRRMPTLPAAIFEWPDASLKLVMQAAKRPAVFVTYERAYGYDEVTNAKANHQLFIARLDARTLRDAPWTPTPSAGNTTSTAWSRAVFHLPRPADTFRALEMRSVNFDRATQSLIYVLECRNVALYDGPASKSPKTGRVRIDGEPADDREEKRHYVMRVAADGVPVVKTVQPRGGGVELSILRLWNGWHFEPAAVTRGGKAVRVIFFRRSGEKEAKGTAFGNYEFFVEEVSLPALSS